MEKGTVMIYHCPRWDELPSLELYMDQALIVIDEAVRPLLPAQETAATATMINNYVKIRLVAPSVKKKYTRQHLARLIMITLLKRVLSMTELACLLEEEDISGQYDQFCQELELRLRETFAAPDSQLTPTDCPPLLAAAVMTLACKLRFEDIAAQSQGETDCSET